ncbi:hypothetical protein AB0P02_21525 [Streptomyces griseoluteus]|uniref:hypothetical protein n=1 Tax=Streptomyces griseoluteus TaxID=29306 RepID=UPI00341AD38F
MSDSTNTEVRDLRALLAAVLAALTVPNDDAEYQRRLEGRAREVRTVIEAALAKSPDNLGWEVDYLRSQITAEEFDAGERNKNRCRRCSHPFEPSDQRFDGRARYQDTPWCRRCIDNCREGSAEHSCVICNPAHYGVVTQ